MRQFSTFFLLIAALLSLGTVVSRKGAIERTQTDPVAYEEKKKEEKEGKKGPPVPTFKLFPKEKFLIEGPIEKGKSEAFEKKRVGEEELEDWNFWFEEDAKKGGEFKPDAQADDTSDTEETPLP